MSSSSDYYVIKVIGESWSLYWDGVDWSRRPDQAKRFLTRADADEAFHKICIVSYVPALEENGDAAGE